MPRGPNYFYKMKYCTKSKMAARIGNFIQSNIFAKCTNNLLRSGGIFEETTRNALCNRCLRSRSHTTSRYNGEKRSFDKPQKRKVLRKIKAEICSQNILNLEMEKAARSRKLLIPLDEVRHGWSSKQYPYQVKTMSSYLGIYEDMFNGRSFRPTVVMNVNYQDGDSVHYGNFLQPVKTSCEPKVSFDPKNDSLTTLLMVNLDGNIFSRNDELLHWMVGNIPNGDGSAGEVISQYIPPCPAKGTGYHRFVFCLLNQTTRCDFEELHATYNARCLASRSFKTTTFLERFQLDPVGLCFFQASWDRSVSNTFTEILGMKEPVYDLEPFLTPNQKKRLKVKEIFANKYTNM